MTVQELIEKLQETDPSFDVVMEVGGEHYFVTSLDEVTNTFGKTFVALTDFPVDPS